MNELNDVLVGLASMESEDRREALVEHRAVLFSDAFVAFTQREIDHAAAAHSLAWPELPEVITTAFIDGADDWRQRLQVVWADMLEVAAKLTPAEPEPSAPDAAPTSVDPRPSMTSPSVPSSVINTAPTEEEIYQDFVEWDRRQHDNLREDIDYNRIQDDAIDYSTPSYDSYSSYDDPY